MNIDNSLAHLMCDISISIISVDCFDTILLRNSMPEIERFHIIARQLAKLRICRNNGLTAKALLQSRLHAIKIAYNTASLLNGCLEARHSDILKIQLAWLNSDLNLIDEFRKTEIEVEAESLHPNTGLASLCSSAKKAGKTIIVVSDMYLDRSSIANLLQKHGLGDLYHRIYVSSEYGSTKLEGGLFRRICNDENVVPSAVLHIGDSWYSDYKIPKSLGLNAYWAPRSWRWRALYRIRNILAQSKYHSLK
jgi:predicted HAD superfamily hydrolase